MEIMRTNHFSCSTEKTYIGWHYRFILMDSTVAEMICAHYFHAMAYSLLFV